MINLEKDIRTMYANELRKAGDIHSCLLPQTVDYNPTGLLSTIKISEEVIGDSYMPKGTGVGRDFELHPIDPKSGESLPFYKKDMRNECPFDILGIF